MFSSCGVCVLTLLLPLSCNFGSPLWPTNARVSGWAPLNAMIKEERFRAIGTKLQLTQHPVSSSSRASRSSSPSPAAAQDLSSTRKPYRGGPKPAYNSEGMRSAHLMGLGELKIKSAKTNLARTLIAYQRSAAWLIAQIVFDHRPQMWSTHIAHDAFGHLQHLNHTNNKHMEYA